MKYGIPCNSVQIGLVLKSEIPSEVLSINNDDFSVLLHKFLHDVVMSKRTSSTKDFLNSGISHIDFAEAFVGVPNLSSRILLTLFKSGFTLPSVCCG